MSETDPATSGSESSRPAVGETVFTEGGEALGVVRERIDGGFVVSVGGDDTEGGRSTGGKLGEAYLMWRCMECGEMGTIESLPEQCPGCEADRESLYYWTED